MIKDIIKDNFMAFALAASAMAMLTGCSADITDTATTTRTVTATIDGMTKPGFSTPSSSAKATRTAIDGLTSTWEKGDQMTVTYSFFSDEAGANAIAATECPDGLTQTLTYDGAAWTVSPAVITLPPAIRSMKATYSYSREYTAQDDATITAETKSTTIRRGTESFNGTTDLSVISDITATDIKVATPTSWTRTCGAVIMNSLPTGSGAKLTLSDGTTYDAVTPTKTTDGTTNDVDLNLTGSFIFYVAPDATGKTSQMEATTGNKKDAVAKFTVLAGSAYVIAVEELFSPWM